MPEQPVHGRARELAPDSAEDKMAVAAIDEHERDAPGSEDRATLEADEWPPPPGPTEWRQHDGY